MKLPNTPSLINEVLRFSSTSAGKWLADDGLRLRLSQAFEFFYPDAKNAYFQPDVVDFFSSLRTYLDIGAGLSGTGFNDAADLYRLLKRAIAHVLVSSQKAIDPQRFESSAFLEDLVQPGNIIITSNWDTLVESFAAAKGIPLRLSSRSRHFPESEVSLLKLHGSIDWCQVSARVSGHGDDDYAHLSERQNADRPYSKQLPGSPSDLIRVRSTGGDLWQKLKSRTREPWMVTMVTGKQDDLGPLQEVWRDAYRALSWAETLEIIGYSLPPDDVEIRTILRAGVRRGERPPKIIVRNPAPDVHYRVRAFLDRGAESDFQPVSL